MNRGMRPTMAMIIVVMASGCVRPDNTEEMVRGALEQANIGEVDVDRDQQTVRLTGTVDTLADRARAEELATAIVGTTGHVENEIVVAGLGTSDSADVTR